MAEMKSLRNIHGKEVFFLFPWQQKILSCELVICPPHFSCKISDPASLWIGAIYVRNWQFQMGEVNFWESENKRIESYENYCLWRWELKVIVDGANAASQQSLNCLRLMLGGVDKMLCRNFSLLIFSVLGFTVFKVFEYLS